MLRRPAPLRAARRALVAAALCAAAAAAGCSSPSPRFGGAAPVVVEVGRYRFDVYARGDEAQAIRTNPLPFPPLVEVRAAAAEAIRRATGCEVPAGGVRGDVAIVTARLSCPAQ